MSNETRVTPPRFLPALLAAVCGLALPAPAFAQGGNPFGGSGEEPASGGNPFASGDVASDGVDVEVSEHMTVDLHVQDEELANVLQILSLQSEKNILVSGDVAATVNANLYNVTFYEALESILNVNGYGYIEKGNFIYVYTLEEIAEIEQAARKPVTRVVRLNYLNANDAAEFVVPLLSEIGSIKSNGDVEAWSVPDGSPTGDETYALASTLVLYDYPEHIEEIEELLADLDSRPSQVLVEATILETSLRELNGFGIDFSFISDLEFSDFIDIGGPLGTTQGIINGGDGSSDGLSPADNEGFSGTSNAGNTAGGPATFKLGIIDDNISFFLRALDDITDVSVLSRPKIVALNRQPARVLVGRRIGYLSTTSTETSTTQTVEFLDTGTELKFRAFVGNDGFIRMELHPSTSTGETRDASGASGAAVTIPEEVTQEITTNVLVRDGSTIVLGGLFRESTTLSRRQVPVLGDIPLIGAAFRGHDDDTRRTEIIFMITPTIVNDQVLSETGDTATDYVENVRSGSRAGLLPWSRDRQSAELNVKAEKAAMEGEPDKALYLLRRSLELNPMQPDAIQLREQILQKEDRYPSRGVLEDVFDEELNDRISSIEPLPAEPTANAGQDAERDDDQLMVAGPIPDDGDETILSLPPEMEEQLVGGQSVPTYSSKPERTASADQDGGDRLDPPDESAFAGEPGVSSVFDGLIDEASGDEVVIDGSRGDAPGRPALAERERTETGQTQSGQTQSSAAKAGEDLLKDLRLTVTVAPAEDEPQANTSDDAGERTTVTMTPDAAFGRDRDGSDRTSSAGRSSASAAERSDRGPAFTPDSYEGSSLAGLERDEEPSRPTPLRPTDADRQPGLIGPAFVDADDEDASDDAEFARSDFGMDVFEITSPATGEPFAGGLWIWFRDTVVLDTGETDVEALTGADPDDD